MNNSPEEKWKDIPGYEGLYKISNKGYIKRCGRYLNNYLGAKRHIKEKIFIGRLSTYGYYMFTLTKNGKKKNFSVHRLVAQAFIPNHINKRTVNHINGIKTDNRVENLEWNTYKENAIHAWKMGFYDDLINKRKKEVLMLNLKNKPLLRFSSITEAGEYTNTQISNITFCCKGTRPTAGGYKWGYYKKGVVL